MRGGVKRSPCSKSRNAVYIKSCVTYLKKAKDTAYIHGITLEDAVVISYKTHGELLDDIFF